MPRHKFSRHRPTAVDLFSGCGGLTLGLKRAGFDVVGAVEIAELAVESYTLNHPEVALHSGDIRTLSANAALEKFGLMPGDLDLLAGCPPCQGFSSMRTLNGYRGVEDKRNELIFDFLRFVRIFQPKTLMMENVPGLVDDWRFREFCAAIRVLGYNALEYDVLNAADYGVPQRRRRLILLAGRLRPIPFAPKSNQQLTVFDAIGHLPHPGNSGDPIHDLGEARTERVMDLIRRIPKNGGSRADLGANSQLPCHRRCNGFKDVYGRMSWNNCAPTITSGCVNPSKGRFLHPSENRTITLREAALLQTFPANYQFSLRRGKLLAAEMIGNALPPEFIRRHATQIRKYLADQ